jgi:hypothetical protein
MIPLSLALLAFGGASGPDVVSGGAAIAESADPRFGDLALAVRDAGPKLPAAQIGGAKEAASTDPGASDRYLPSAWSVWLWYLLLSAGLLVTMGSLLLLALWLGRRVRDDLISTRPRQTTRPLAFLDSLDGSGRRHGVTGPAYRIGRHSDNDLSIRDASVSRQHAEINLKRSGNFTITDLDSMNGVFVNEKKIDSVILADGDIIEIGDKSFRFRITQRAAPSAVQTSAE